MHQAQGSPIAEEAIRRIAELYAIEKVIRGSPPDQRVQARQAEARIIFDDLETWLAQQLTAISGKSPLAAAIRYALSRMGRLRPHLQHGGLELDNDAAERAMRAIALGRKTYLFVGSASGGKAEAIADTLIETAKLDLVDPQRWLADTLACIQTTRSTRSTTCCLGSTARSGHAGRLRVASASTRRVVEPLYQGPGSHEPASSAYVV